jgi:hypothetical protein
MRREHGQKVTGCAGTTCRRCAFLDQALQISFQNCPPASLKASALLQYPVIEAGRHTVKIFEQTIRTVRYFQRIDPAGARIQPHGVALSLKPPRRTDVTEVQQRMPQGIQALDGS